MAQKRKKVRVRRSLSAPTETEVKPTLNINASQLSGKDLDVGKTVQLTVTGRVTGENIEPYPPNKGKKRYTVEVNKVSLA